MHRRSTTRRAFVAAAGAAALAGCSDAGSGGQSDEEIPPTELPDVPDEGEAVPVVGDDLPVDIERDHLAEAAGRVTELLEPLPLPLGPEAVPNGVVSGELATAAAEARSGVETARSSPTRLSALASLRRARTEARFAAEGWAFVEDDRTAAALREELAAAADEAEAFRANREYVGDDPVRAAVVHARIERYLDRAADRGGPSAVERSNDLLTVAEWGDHAESAQAHLSDARYLDDRFTASLSSSRDLGPTFADAADALRETLRERRRELPSPPTDGGDRDLAVDIQYRLRSDADDAVDRVLDADRPATAVLGAVEGLVDVLAYGRIRRRADEEGDLRPQDGADVRRVRSAALEAVPAALETAPRPALGREILSEVAERLTFADDELRRTRRAVRPAALDDAVRRYLAATARARSVPEATERVAATLTG